MITVFGSIGMDLLFSLPHLPAVGETVLTPAYTTAMGGKGANQAVAAARDGGRVRFVGSAGQTVSATRRDRYSGPTASIWPASRPSMRLPVWLRFGLTRKDAIRSRLPREPIF